MAPGSAGMANQNSDALLGAIFNALHGDAMPNEAPATLEEAKKRADWPQWKEAMDEEINTLCKMGTWKKADLPKDRKPILC